MFITTNMSIILDLIHGLQFFQTLILFVKRCV
jgi:hypothetical protein